MNPAQRDEWNAIRAEHRELRTKLQALETRLVRFEQAAEEEKEDATIAAMLAAAPPAPVVPVPRPLSSVPPPLPAAARTVARPPVPPVQPPVLAQTVPPPVPPPPPAARESLEMQIGTTWLVRAGIVLLLTALAFAGSHLYYHVVPMLGPLAKVALLYVGASALTGVGAWLERSRVAGKNEALRNYARVVLAGGLAAVYYVTYSAHWNPHLRVVSDPLLAGALLLGWAAFMVWLANRRGSELLATFAILLAFYTSAVNEISSFTLVANLFLAGGAVYLLRRQLWQIFPFASLLATFGSYGFWRFSHAYIEGTALIGGAPPRLALTSAGFWIESGFLLLYWLLFTWAVFTTDERVLPRWRRAGFVTVNNGAFFLLVTSLLLAAYPGSFWRWSLGFGVVLLVLAETCRRLPRLPDADTENAYLLQGVLLVTLGFIGYFSGWQLSLVLAVQSAVLLWRAGLRASRLLLGLSCAVASVSFLYALWHLHELDVAKVWVVGLGEGALLVGNAWWSQRLLDHPQAETPALFRPALAQVPTWFAALGSAVWFWMIERPVTAEVGRAPLLAVAAVSLTASVYLLRVRALPWFALAYLTVAHGHWLAVSMRWDRWYPVLPAWNPLVLLIATLALGHWWQWRRTTDGAWRYAGRGPVVWAALLAVTLLNFWLGRHPVWGDAGWIAEAAVLSLLVLGYGLVTGWHALAAAGQLLLLASVVHFFYRWEDQFYGDGAGRWLALSPSLTMVLTLAVGRRFLPGGRLDQGWCGAMVRLYEVAALGLFLCWVDRCVPREVQFALLSLVGAGVFALGCVYREKRWLILSAVPTVLAQLVSWFVIEGVERGSWLSLAGSLLLVGQQRVGNILLAKDAPAYFPAKAQGALMTAAVLSAWAFLTARMGRWEGSAFTLATSWALFAPVVFAAGLLLRERVYRWLSLVVLAATLGHIVLFDISQLDTLGKAVSFFALGLVVLGVGFFYVRFQAKFRDLL